ncbi:MAG: hypothetical protein QOF29_436 [bacterium]|jgi:hypothetical protein
MAKVVDTPAGARDAAARRGGLRQRAVEQLVARRRSLEAAMAAARERPDEVDMVDVMDLAMAVAQAEALVDRLERQA